MSLGLQPDVSLRSSSRAPALHNKYCMQTLFGEGRISQPARSLLRGYFCARLPAAATVMDGGRG